MREDILDQMTSVQGERPRTLKTSQGKRFANYLIDRIVLYLATFGLSFIVAYILESIAPGSMDFIAYADEDDLGVRLIDLAFSYVCLVIIYTLLEYYTKGRTIGKFLTKTRAVRDDEDDLTFRDAMMRSLVRIVPFEPFSFLSDDGRSGWHDVWTDTKVIDA